MERGFFDNDNSECKTDDGNDGSSMPSLIDFDDFRYVDTDSDNNSMSYHVDQILQTRANDGSEDGSKKEVNRNGSWDVLPALIARD